MCLGKEEDGTPCKRTGDICKFHEYLKDYTTEMIEQCKFCKCCRKMKFTGEYASCEDCRQKPKIKKEVVLCAHEECKYKKSKENKYCGKHQLDVFKDETEELGLKCCKNVDRGCRSQLQKDGRSACETCLAKYRAEDHAARNNLVKTETEKQCSNCCKMFPLEHYKGLKKDDNKMCQDCRAYCKKQDEKRDKEHINELARKNEKKPERREVKKQWVENNPEKVILSDLNYKARQIEEDQEAYLKKQAENAKNWRTANPEKVKIMNKKRVESIEVHFAVYKESARKKGLVFDLSFELFHTIVTTPCYYCGIIQEKGFNGIDRLDCTKGYTETNSSPCCKMCNFMKGDESPNTFIHHVEHILTHQGIIEGRRFESKNSKGSSFNDYKKRADKKKLDFLLTEETFKQEIMKDCYLCGKQKTDTHCNGLDRVDNAKGYLIENVRSCCVNCNYMKRDYSYDLFLEKCKRVYEHKPSEIEITPVVRIKKTKEQNAEEIRLRKQKSRENKKNKMGEEEYRKTIAKEAADRRRAKRAANQ
jgi:hypothetical protein